MQNLTFRNDIQGLRAIAVLAVIIFHLDSTLLPGGFIGVDIFLVISGYLITSIILKKKHRNNFSLLGFYKKRFNRIVPAYLTLLAIVSISMSVLLIPEDFTYFKESLYFSSFFASNLHFENFGSYFAPNANELPLLHTWSLAVEMQFYVLFPLLLLALPKNHFTKIITLITILLFISASYQIYFNEKDVYFSLTARIPEFLVGAIIAKNKIDNPKGIIQKNKQFWAVFSILLIAPSLYFIDSKSGFPGLLALPACLGTAIILALDESFLSKLLSKPALTITGNLSYSLYLWHWPVLAAIRYYSESYHLNLQLFLLFAALTIVFSASSYYAVERGLGKRLTQAKPAYIIPLTTVIFSAIFPISAQLNSGITTPLPLSAKRYAPPEEICHGKIIGDCIRGDLNSIYEALLIGDSHAAQLNLFAEVVGKENGQKFKIITASSCVTFPKFDYERIPSWSQKKCQKQIKEVTKLIPKYKTIIIAGMWSYQVTSQEFINAFDEFMMDLNALDKKVIVLAQTPLLDSNILRLRRFEKIGFERTIETERNWDEGNRLIESITKKYENTHFLDLSDIPLFATAPFFKGQLIYHDRSHLNEAGATHYGKAAASYFKEI